MQSRWRWRWAAWVAGELGVNLRPLEDQTDIISREGWGENRTLWKREAGRDRQEAVAQGGAGGPGRSAFSYYRILVSANLFLGPWSSDCTSRALWVNSE